MSDVILPVHIAALVFSGLHVLLADHVGFLWLLGKKETLDAQVVHRYHMRVWLGLGALIVTGSLLFWPAREYLLTQSPAFMLKMGFVAALLMNSIAIGFLQKIATTKAARDLTAYEAVPLLISGAVSGMSWLGALTAAFFLYD